MLLVTVVLFLVTVVLLLVTERSTAESETFMSSYQSKSGKKNCQCCCMSNEHGMLYISMGSHDAVAD